jgi:hypothetical protein
VDTLVSVDGLVTQEFPVIADLGFQVGQDILVLVDGQDILVLVAGLGILVSLDIVEAGYRVIQE